MSWLEESNESATLPLEPKNEAVKQFTNGDHSVQEFAVFRANTRDLMQCVAAGEDQRFVFLFPVS